MMSSSSVKCTTTRCPKNPKGNRFRGLKKCSKCESARIFNGMRWIPYVFRIKSVEESK